jgi:uncharacterized protein YkwD
MHLRTRKMLRISGDHYYFSFFSFRASLASFLRPRATFFTLAVTAFAMVVFFPPPPAWGQWSIPRPAEGRHANSASIITLQAVEEAVFGMTNDIRQQHGLPPLLKGETFRLMARDFSTDMLRRNYFSHTDPDGRSLTSRVPMPRGVHLMGENIWTGNGYDITQTKRLAQMIMVGWMNSSGHRANILKKGYTHLGVGVKARGQEIRATQLFIGQGED